MRYYGPDGLRHNAPVTYERKKDAELALSKLAADIARDDWFDPEAGKVDLGPWGRDWLAERDLAKTTRERYEFAFHGYIEPTFGNRPINEVKEKDVRGWYAGMLDTGAGRPSAAKAYRVLRAMLNTALDDGMIKRNPCRIKGAGDDKSPERPVLSIDEVLRVVDATPPRLRMMVLLATFTSLRIGELAALTRRNIDVSTGFVTVVENQAQLSNGELYLKDPKSAAGRRSVPVPDDLLDELKQHLAEYAEPGEDGRVFVGPKGGKIRRQNFRKIWIKALSKAKVRQVHFHDLRHTGNQFAADDGASLRELMERMGHSSPRAAMRYLHVSKGRSREIAVKLNARLRDARPKPGQDSLGHAEGTEAKKSSEIEGIDSLESGPDLQKHDGGDEGT
ncbi:tyrosine-type recombinase/integrase [Kribbella sp. NPDC004536]|uniref:tyrosine-type recombinase/integrase n=1 Tax=Kribbella sp. NPDC004536 TaxID=3364106 RepID=UPI0036C93B0D